MRDRIIMGELLPGEKLPSSRELAQQININPNTAARVYTEMEKLGLAFTKRGIGTFVTEDEKLIKGMKQERTIEVIDDFFRSMEQLGYQSSDIIGLLKGFEE